MGPVSIRRVSQDQQLSLFDGALLYVSQSDAASALGLTTRQVQYWEAQGLLHPELPTDGRNRRYTKRDLVELRFIKSLVVDQGYNVPSLKEKLEQLQAPYDYDYTDLFWDPRDLRWRSRAQLLTDELQRLRPNLDALVEKAIDKLLPGDPGRASSALLDLIREVFEGRAEKPRARTRRKSKSVLASREDLPAVE